MSRKLSNLKYYLQPYKIFSASPSVSAETPEEWPIDSSFTLLDDVRDKGFPASNFQGLRQE